MCKPLKMQFLKPQLGAMSYGETERIQNESAVTHFKLPGVRLIDFGNNSQRTDRNSNRVSLKYRVIFHLSAIGSHFLSVFFIILT